MTKNPLEIPLTLRHIFSYLSVGDLIRCSQVSKQWNREARSVLRDLRKCYAVVDGDLPCAALTRLDSDLRDMSSGTAGIPYNGLYLHIRAHDPSTCRHDILALRETFIATGWEQLRYLKYRYDRVERQSWPYSSELCPALKFIGTVIRKNGGGTFEEISIEKVRVMKTDFNELFDHPWLSSSGFCLPNLKKFRYNDSSWENELELFFQQLVKKASKLEEIDVWVYTGNLDVVPRKLFGSVKRYGFFLDFEHVKANLEFLAAEPKLLRELCLSVEYAPVRHEIRWDIIIKLMQLSADTLEILSVDTHTAVRFHSVNQELPVLRNLKVFKINLGPPGDLWCPKLWDYIAAINFSRISPNNSNNTEYTDNNNLNFCVTLNLSDQWEYDTNEEEDLKYFLSEHNGVPPPELQACGDTSRVTKLNVIEKCTLASVVPNLSSVFPEVRDLSFSDVAGEIEPCLWNCWPKLRTLSLGIRDPSTDNPNDSVSNLNLDSVFCGIFPEEVEFLRQMNKNYLKHVNIVPVQPSPLTSNDLQSLEISFVREKKDPSITGTPGLAHMISDVSKFLLFRRKPALKVTLTGSLNVLRFGGDHATKKEISKYFF